MFHIIRKLALKTCCIQYGRVLSCKGDFLNGGNFVTYHCVLGFQRLMIFAPQAQFQLVARLGRRDFLLSPHDACLFACLLACGFAIVVRAKDS